MKHLITTILIIFISLPFLHAQSSDKAPAPFRADVTQPPYPKHIQKLYANSIAKRKVAQLRYTESYAIPIKIWIFSASGGNTALMNQAVNKIAEINNGAFQNTGIHFEVCDSEEIIDSK